MDYTWLKIEEHGQEHIGFIEIYLSETDRGNILAIVNYLPQFTDNKYKKDVCVTLFYEGNENNITDGFFHSIYNDICELIGNNENNKLPKKSEKLEYILTQTFTVKKLPEIKYFSHGDFGITKD